MLIHRAVCVLRPSLSLVFLIAEPKQSRVAGVQPGKQKWKSMLLHVERYFLYIISYMQVTDLQHLMINTWLSKQFTLVQCPHLLLDSQVSSPLERCRWSGCWSVQRCLWVFLRVHSAHRMIPNETLDGAETGHPVLTCMLKRKTSVFQSQGLRQCIASQVALLS